MQHCPKTPIPYAIAFGTGIGKIRMRGRNHDRGQNQRRGTDSCTSFTTATKSGYIFSSTRRAPMKMLIRNSEKKNKMTAPTKVHVNADRMVCGGTLMRIRSAATKMVRINMMKSDRSTHHQLTATFSRTFQRLTLFFNVLSFLFSKDQSLK